MTRTYAERTQTWADPDLPGVLHATIEDTNQEYKLFHEWYLLSRVTVCPGRIRWIYRGISEPYDADTLYLIEPNQTTFIEAGADGGGCSVLFISPAVMDSATRDFEQDGSASFPVHRCRDAEVLGVFDEAALAIREHAPLLERQSRLACLLALLLERFAGKTLPPGSPVLHEEGVLRARDLILSRYAEPLALDELSGDTGMSRFALVRAFTARFGISPHDYLVKVRLAKAQDLIGRGARFADAAAAVGFADQSHFIRHFKKVYRLTPGEFWKQRPGS